MDVRTRDLQLRRWSLHAACCARGGLTNWATQMQAELGRLEGILVKIGLDHCLLGRLACCLCSARSAREPDRASLLFKLAKIPAQLV